MTGFSNTYKAQAAKRKKQSRKQTDYKTGAEQLYLIHYFIDYACGISGSNAGKPIRQDGSCNKHGIEEPCDSCGLID